MSELTQEEWAKRRTKDGGDMNNNFSHDEIVEDVNEYFKSKDAGKYARHYLIRQLKEE